MPSDTPPYPPGEFRAHIPDITTPRFTTMRGQDAHEYAEAFISGGNPPWLHALYLHWKKLFQEPFKGITNDGTSLPPQSLSSFPANGIT